MCGILYRFIARELRRGPVKTTSVGVNKGTDYGLRIQDQDTCFRHFYELTQFFLFCIYTYSFSTTIKVSTVSALPVW